MNYLISKFFIAFLLFCSVSFSAESEDLDVLMEQVGVDFKTIIEVTQAGDNSDANQIIVSRLKLNLIKSKNILPDGISPNDEELVREYNSFMNDLIRVTVLFEEAFTANPMEKKEALNHLRRMNSIRKKAHNVFR